MPRTETKLQAARYQYDREFPEVVEALTNGIIDPEKISARAFLSEPQHDYLWSYLDIGSVTAVGRIFGISTQNASVTIRKAIEKVSKTLKNQ